jgi:ComF family protein
MSIWRRTAARLTGAAIEALLPQDCFLCGSRSGCSLLCPGCVGGLPAAPKPCCPLCALPTPAGEICGACLREPPRFDATLARYTYDFPVDRLIQALKYGGTLAVASYLGSAVANLPLPEADIVLALPLHPRRLRKRGFNQATQIAREVASRHRLPLEHTLVERVSDTPPQTGLPWAERRRNVRGSFLCRTDLSGKRIIVVDDVMTTGATLNELAGVLKRSGAECVTNLVVARTLPYRDA